MRYLSLPFIGCLFTLMMPARADNGALYVAPGPSTIISADVIKRIQGTGGVTPRKLGDLIGSLLKSPTSTATDLLVTTECGRYKSAIVTYADGSVKSMSLGDAPVSKQDMDQAKTAMPILRVIEQGGCAS